MPEGDTIFRTARSMRQWLVGRTVTAARSSSIKANLDQVIGETVESIDAKAKHLLIRFANGVTLHTHMKMTGSWHVYQRGDRWRKPAWQARVVIECDDRIAVGFDVPVVELLETSLEAQHPALAGLGPDILSEVVDLEGIRLRMGELPGDVTIGEAILNQRVVSGIGNIYRCEALFLQGIHPRTVVRALESADLDRLLETASHLMESSIAVTRGRQIRWVYDRAGHSCRRCSGEVQSAQLGLRPRTIYWCPACQPEI